MAISKEARIILLKKELTLLAELRKRQCQRSLYDFVLDAYLALNPDDPLVENWHMKYICDVLQDEIMRVIKRIPKAQDVIINVPPRSLKSFIVTCAAPAWGWIHKPSLKFIGSSYSGDLSLKHNMMTKDIVESDWYRQNWGSLVKISPTKNTKEYFETTAGGIRTCTSTGGTVTGIGADIILVDDPLSPKNAESEVERATANRFFDQSLKTRMNKPTEGVFIIIMQRLHQDDLTGYLLNKNPEKYKNICIPLEYNPELDNVRPKELMKNYTNNLFFEKRFPMDWCISMRSELGARAYAGQMLQSPKLEGGGLIKGKWFGRFTMNDIPPAAVWDFVADTAYTAKTVNDPSAIMAYTIFDNNLYIRGFSRVYKEFPALVKHIKAWTSEMGYSFKSRIYIEPKASGMSAAQELKSKTALNVILDEPPKDDKVSRISAHSAAIEAGRVFLLDGASWLDNFIDEVELFPNGSHDESIDLLSMAMGKHKRKTKTVKTKYTFFNKR